MADSERNELEPLMTVDEVAEYLGLHPQTVYAKSRSGEIPSLKIGSRLRFRRSDVREYVDAFRRAPEEAAAS